MIRQIIGMIFLLTFLSFLGYKFYIAVEDMEYASLIIFGAVLVILVVLIGVGKQLKGY